MTARSETEATAEWDPFASRWAWRGGAVSGVIAAAVMGLAIWGMRIETLQVAISGLYGQSGNLVAGWIVHLVHGALFGTVFSLVLTDPTLDRVRHHRWRTVLAGLIFGLVLAVVGAGIIMPIWMGAVGLSNVPGIPNVTVPSLLWHLIYGLVLGVLFPSVEGL